ncbi:hypothetical protein ABT156_09575, partial [Streptomyces sp. NPDC001833]
MGGTRPPPVHRAAPPRPRDPRCPAAGAGAHRLPARPDTGRPPARHRAPHVHPSLHFRSRRPKQVNYPVIAEHILATVQGTWWSRRRRRDDVPPLPPGAVHVFRVGGNYRTFPEGMVFDPSHPDVLDASSVSIVDTRARLVDVERPLPSVSEADNFTMRASFTCQVTDPTVIARQGIIDVTVPL